MREADMRDQALTEKGRHPPAGPVDKLIGDHEIKWSMFLLERTDRAQRKNPFHAQGLKSVNIRAKIQLGGRNTMAFARGAQETPRASRPSGRRRRGPRARPMAFRWSRSSSASNPGIEYNPLPPMIPMVGFIPVSIPSARRRWRMDERIRKVSTSSGARLIEQPRAGSVQPLDRSGQIRHANRDVMQSFAAFIQKLSDHRIRLGGLQQLDARIT